MSLIDQLNQTLRRAVTAALDVEADPLLGPSTNPKFGDYQANVAMGLAKKLGQKPRDLAEKIVAALDAPDLIEQATLAGPGFINLRIKADALSQAAIAMLADEQLGVAPAQPKQTIVVDYSSPNVAKEMHVGHLRSTIIGDAIARVFTFLGHNVIKQNHVGDWGTQFGMLLEYLGESTDDADNLAIADLNAFYQQAKKRFDDDADFATRARNRVVALQSGDSDTLEKWRKLVAESAKHFRAAYNRLGILLTDDDIRGESAYNDALPGVVDQLQQKQLLEESEGAQVVYPEGFTGKNGERMAMIVRKSDGGYLYATTDLAAARYRIEQLGADRIVYVTDARQGQHFAMVFQTLRQAGWASPEVRLDHVAFGTIMGPDRKPFKTRTGDTVKLADLLDEAESRARELVADKNPDLDEAKQTAIAHAVGIGALKYGDLSSDRIKDYVFDWSRMLALEGNTAPYLQNAYVRIQSIFRKAGVGNWESGIGIQIAHEAERALALKLLQFPGVVDAVADSLEPHRLCTYLYELAAGYHQFYEHCPVLKADDATRDSRLQLSRLVARTLKQGLTLLGIDVVEQM